MDDGAMTVLVVALLVAVVAGAGSVAWRNAADGDGAFVLAGLAVIAVLVAGYTLLSTTDRHTEDCTITTPASQAGGGPAGVFAWTVQTRECGQVYDQFSDRASVLTMVPGHTYRLTFVGRLFLRRYEGVVGEVVPPP